MAGGALAAAAFDALIGESITPMTVGYVLFAAGSIVCVLAARRST